MNEPKRRRGRPPRDPANATGRASFHIGLRLPDAKRDELLRLVAEAQERARLARVPAHVTPSNLVYSWILEAIDREIAKSDAEKKRKK